MLLLFRSSLGSQPYCYSIMGNQEKEFYVLCFSELFVFLSFNIFLTCIYFLRIYEDLSLLSVMKTHGHYPQSSIIGLPFSIL